MGLPKGHILGVRSNSRAPELSLNALQWTYCVTESVGNPSPLFPSALALLGMHRAETETELCTPPPAWIALSVIRA